MEQRFCRVCGKEIFVEWFIPEQSFRITAEGEFERDDNNDVMYGGYHPRLNFYCSGDREHDIESNIDIKTNEWMDEVKIEFWKNKDAILS